MLNLFYLLVLSFRLVTLVITFETRIVGDGGNANGETRTNGPGVTGREGKIEQKSLFFCDEKKKTCGQMLPISKAKISFTYAFK